MGPCHRSLELVLLGMGAAVLLGTSVAACTGGGPANRDPDADPYRPDAEIPRCEMSSATIGRCELANSGDCTGVPEEERVFVPLAQGDSVSMVVGPQASLMFVLALQTTGIYPGDPDNPASSENTNVEITLLLDESERMAHYRGRPYFKADTGNPENLEASGLFVIVEAAASTLDGKTVTAVAKLTDKEGLERCGKIIFTAQR